MWGKHVGESMFFQPKIVTPFWHLQNEPLGSLHLKNGKSLSTVTSPYSVSRLRENTFAVLDPELCDLILNTESREILKTILIKRYITDSHIDINTILPMLTIIGTMFSLAS